MARFQEAEQRLFKNVFVCRKCKHKIRATNIAVIEGKVKCRFCGRKALRQIKRK